MSDNKHDVEGEGAKPRDHDHPRHHVWHHVHRDWRLWFAVALMLALIFYYVISNDLSLRPGKPANLPTPAANAP
jgi:hypothetical protein